MTSPPQKNSGFSENEILKIQHYFSSGVYAKRMILQAGASINTHQHNFDHMSILAQGNAEVTVDGQSKIYFAPTVIEIKAKKTHHIKAIFECHWYCIHATNIVDPELIDEEIIIENKNVV